ncbi:MAG: hypothetical protein HYY91_05085 [Candidatus Omnitrophica bacterium]|nr:hypothetical protein [Candidatus Omnitrophota bacterium]
MNVQSRTRRSRCWRFPSWGLRAAQGGLCGVIITACLAWAVLMVWPIPQPLAAHVALDRVDGPPVGPRPGPQADAAWPSFASAIPRPLFQAGGSSSSATTPLQPGAPSLAGSTLTSRLSVSGVVLGDPSQAVIEDAQTKKAYLVTAGQRFLDGVMVEAIRTDRVILDLQGERIELVR